ncbi:1,4-benzoquinone reductase [Amylocystis lapponica]|nr:1,4-benzoquinone reductase [Amylocystis lapponica]
MSPKVAIVIYTVYGHLAKLAEAVKSGVESAGGTVTIFHLADYDAFIFGIPTRYGNFPVQWKAFWDQTGPLWAAGKLAGKYASVFVSTGTPGGGQETTVINALSTLTHHGIIFVPLGYAKTFAQLANVSEVRGGSPWGAGTFAGGDGSRQPSPLELELGKLQGEWFYETVNKVTF